MNMSKLITLVATIAVIGLPLTLSSVDVEAATTGKRVKRGAKKSSKSSKRTKRTHRLSKKKKTSKKKRAAASRSRARRTQSTTRRTRTTTVRQRGHAQRSSHRVVRRKTVVRHNTGHHVGRTSYRTSYNHHHTSSCSHQSHSRVIVRHHAPRRTIVHHHTPRRTVVYHETRQTTHANSNASIRSSGGSSAEFYINGGLGMSSLRISEVSELPLNATNYRVAIGVKGDLVGLEFGVDGGNFKFDDGTSLNMIGVNVDAKLQPSFGILEPYIFVGVGGYNLYDEVLEEDAGSGAFRAGLGADVRINNVGFGAKYTWSGYSFENDQSYQAISATSSIISANLSFYF